MTIMRFPRIDIMLLCIRYQKSASPVEPDVLDDIDIENALYPGTMAAVRNIKIKAIRTTFSCTSIKLTLVQEVEMLHLLFLSLIQKIPLTAVLQKMWVRGGVW